jgi:L-rhamnonate dehydratase
VKIDKISFRTLRGTIPTDGPFWEERLLRPLDVYDEFRRQGPLWLGYQSPAEQVDERHYRLEATFLRIDTDQGVHGIAGPMSPAIAQIIATQLASLLTGRDPRASEFLWDLMHRALVHGRQGEPMMAISAVDCALWDLKGRWLDQPVWRLLGGPTRMEIPAYASMLGYDVEDLGRVRERARACQEQGYRAQKWFFRHGPMSGPEGMRKNVALVRTLRETLGEDDDIMLDCWQSMDFSYVVELASRIAEYRPRWLEECAMPDRIDTYRRIKQKIPIPLAGAEHEYTRWGFKRFVDQEALDVIQPDIYWCGGLSETLKIAAYASVHDLITIPHGHSTPATIHFSVTQSPIHTPYQEFLVKWNAIHQHFLAHPLVPKGGVIRAPEAPGLNMDLDEAKIESERALAF